MPLSPTPPTPDPWCTATRHGTTYAYRKFRCRCDLARRLAVKDHHLWELAVARVGGPLRVDRTGTVRRLQALSAVGWTFEDLGHRIGKHRSVLQQICRPKHGPTVNRDTAEAVRVVYEKLEQEDGPSDQGRQRAERKGWPDPSNWFGVDMDDPQAQPKIFLQKLARKDFLVDEVAVERLRFGHLSLADARPVDVMAVFTNMRYAERLSAHEAAALVGVDDRVALRYWKRMDRHAR